MVKPIDPKDEAAKGAQKVDGAVKKAKKAEKGGEQKKTEQSKEKDATVKAKDQAKVESEEEESPRAEEMRQSEEEREDQKAIGTDKKETEGEAKDSPAAESENEKAVVKIQEEQAVPSAQLSGEEIAKAHRGEESEAADSDPEVEAPPVTDEDKEVEGAKSNPAVVDADKKSQKSALEIEAEGDSAKQKILADFTPQMVEALGGFEKVMSFPKFENWKETTKVKELTASVMVGSDGGHPYLLFCYIVKKEDGKYYPHIERLVHSAKGWEVSGSLKDQLNIRNSNLIKEGSVEETALLDRIRRLMNHEAIGRLEKSGEGAEVVFYERETEEGTTDLFLWDPSKKIEEQRAHITKLFPHQK